MVVRLIVATAVTPRGKWVFHAAECKKIGIITASEKI